MKRILWTIVSVLVLTLVLITPAQASIDYGLIYDETEKLYSEELETIGTEVLPGFLETYGIDLRVDILTGIGDFTDVKEAAEYLYTEYGYGGSGGNGASLTLLVHEDADGVALDEWYAHFAGDSDEWTTNAPWNIGEVYGIMAAENWEGDLKQDIQTLTDRYIKEVDAMGAAKEKELIEV